jgi:hypothetical protein
MTPEEEDELTEAALITIATIIAVRALWRSVAPNRAQLALEANTAVPLPAVQAGLDAVINEYVNRARVAGEAYRAGGNLDQFAATMTAIIAEANTAAYLAANALAENDVLLAAELRQKSDEKTEEDMVFFLALLAALGAGKIILDGRFIQRLTMYAKSAFGNFWSNATLVQQRRGRRWERRLLGVAEHCPDCIDFAARGWQPVGTLPPPTVGSRCMSNCKCTMIYSTSETRPND